MERGKRARRIRDVVLATASLCLAKSLVLKGPMLVVADGWRARLSRKKLDYVSIPSLEATKLELWVNDDKVAVFAWTGDDFWVARMARGGWEAAHFGLPPYRNNSERWIDVCSEPAVDRSVLHLMRRLELPPAALPREAIVERA